MYTKAQWCTCREVTDTLISTPEILPHLDDHRGPTFSHNNTFNTHEFSNMRKSDKCRGWSFPFAAYMTLLFTSVAQRAQSGGRNSVSK